jgi:hypothetical protein
MLRIYLQERFRADDPVMDENGEMVIVPGFWDGLID